MTMHRKRLVSWNCRFCDSTGVGVRSGKAAGHDYQSRPLVSSIHTLPLALSKLEQLLERPSRPFTPGAGPAWPARTLQAGEFYHVKEQLVYCGVDIAKSYLDAAIANEKRRLANDPAGHRELSSGLSKSKEKCR